MPTLSYSTLPLAGSMDPAIAAPPPPPIARSWLAFWFIATATLYALLWSPDWYPLSDSSLYLSLGRSLAAGRGLTMMGDPVRLTPPLAPMLIALVLKLGGGMGAIQAMMSCLMLVAHTFCFLALRRIFSERLALAATLSAAFSYWVFANAFTIMSEPPCIAALWAGIWLLTLARSETSIPRAWLKIISACALFLLAAATRDAVFALIPGFLLLVPAMVRPGFIFGAILISLGLVALGTTLTLKTAFGKLGPLTYIAAILIPFGAALAILLWKKHAAILRFFDRLRLPLARPEGWRFLFLFVIILGSWLILYRYPPSFLSSTAIARNNASTHPTTLANGATPPIVVAPINIGEGDDEAPLREGRYRATWLYGVPRDWHLATEPPVLAGRWVSEGLVMGTVALFESKVAAIGTLGKIVGLIAWILSMVGLLTLLRRGHWWLLGPAIYFAAIWLQWGTRIKARYMIPVAPILFILVWAGWITLLSRRARKAPDPMQTKRGWWSAFILTALVIIGNLIPAFVEYRVRHGNPGLTAASQPRDFYDIARRGAFSKLVDISAWLQKNSDPGEEIAMNAGAQRRIAYLLSGRVIHTKDVPTENWGEWNSNLAPGASPRAQKRAKALRDFRHNLPAQDRFVIVYVDHPTKGISWPGWHWPLTADPSPPEWWKLYMRGADNQWTEIQIPRADRSYIRAMPQAGI